MIIKVAGIVSTMAIMAVLSGAQAQTESNSNANSSSGAVSGSSSSSGAFARGGNASGNRLNSNQTQGTTTNTGVTLNQTSNASPNTQANNTDTIRGGTNNQNYNQQGGHTTSDNIVRAAPTVYAPPVSGGSPCSLGYSAGASFLGWGAAAGGQVVDAECERRMHVAMLYNAGWKGASKELACNNKEVYMAFRTAGEPCAPRQQWEGNVPVQQPMPMVQQQPTPVGPPTPPPSRVSTVAPKEYPRCNPRAGITDNCRS